MSQFLAGAVKVGLGSVVSLAFFAVTIKVLASVLGPLGVGLFSILRQIQTTAITLATLNGTTALVRGVASRNDRARQRFVASALLLCLGGGSTVVVVLGVFHATWAEWLLAHADGGTEALILFVACATACGVIWSLVSGLLNGTRNLGGLAWAQGLGAACMAVLAYPAAIAIRSGTTYLLAALLCVAPATSASIGAWLISRRGHDTLLRCAFWRDWDRSAAQEFLAVSLTMLATGFLMSLVQLVVKRVVLSELGLAAVGIYDAAWNLSNTYVLLVLSSLAACYLPRLAGTPDPKEQQRLLSHALVFALATMVPLLLVVICLKTWAVNALYTTHFRDSVEIIRWALVGDYFKTISFVLGYSVLARADMRVFLALEILYNAIVLGGSVLVVNHRWLPGLGVVHLVAYGTLAIAYIVVHVWRYNFVPGTLLGVACLTGFAMVASSSWLTWDQREVAWGSLVFWLVLGGIWSAALLRVGQSSAAHGVRTT
jgi:O-antigen/teichoic acid export membrane protein